MLRLLSDVNAIIKLEVPTGSIMSTAVQGSFVNADGTAPTASGIGYQIWTESTGADAWSPDEGATGNVTCLAGIYRAKTDQFDDAVYAAGDALVTSAAGKLGAAGAAAEHVIGYALGNKTTETYNGTSYSFLEYITCG